jgi:hypothetical protein
MPVHNTRRPSNVFTPPVQLLTIHILQVDDTFRQAPQTNSFQLLNWSKDVNCIQILVAYDTDLQLTFVNAVMNTHPTAIAPICITGMSPLSIFLSSIAPSIDVKHHYMIMFPYNY